MICRKRKGTAVAAELSVSGLQTLLSDFSSGVLGELNLDLDLDFDFGRGAPGSLFISLGGKSKSKSKCLSGRGGVH